MRIALLLLAAATLIAAERTGPYLSAGMGLSNYDDDSRLTALDSRNVASYRLGAGAFINSNFAVALEYTQFDAFEGSMTGGAVSERFKAFCADVLLHYPFKEERFDLFAKFGAGQIFWNETGAAQHDNSAATLLYGVGIGARPLPWLTVNVGYDIHHFGMESNVSSYEMHLGSAYIECQVQF